MKKDSRRHKTNYAGVFYRERVHNGRLDKYYVIRYRDKARGRAIEEGVGWQSERITPKKAHGKLCELKVDQSRGIPIVTPREKKKLKKAKAEAEEAKQEQEKKDQLTFDGLFQLYIQRSADDGKVSCNRERSLFKKWISAIIGSIPLKNLAPTDIERVKARMKREGQSPRSVEYALSVVSQTLNHGRRTRVFKGDNVAREVNWPKINNEVTEDLSPDQLQRLLEAIKKDTHPQAGPLMRLALYTGMRRGELFKLRWQDVNFDKAYITLVDPKPGQDQKIPMNDLARELLENHPKTGNSPYVFPGRGGRQRVTVSRHVNRIKKDAGLPKDFRPLHGLRHTFASALASSGQVDMYVLQKLLGHKTPEMTMRYAHLRDQALQRASNIACQIFNPKQVKQEPDKPESKVVPIKK